MLVLWIALAGRRYPSPVHTTILLQLTRYPGTAELQPSRGQPHLSRCRLFAAAAQSIISFGLDRR
jgi:hypothetical protein